MVLALLAIDLIRGIQDQSSEYVYNFGNIEQGLERVQSVIRLARSIHVQVYAAWYMQPPCDIVKEDVNSENVFQKKSYCPFVFTKGFDLDRTLKSQDITDLFIFGYNLYCCVKSAVKIALEREYNVTTSEQLMFLHRQCNDKAKKQHALDLYERDTNFLKTVDDVMDYIANSA